MDGTLPQHDGHLASAGLATGDPVGAPRHAIVVFDCETTGTDRTHDQVIELCIQHGLEDGAPNRVWRIRPAVGIHPGAQAVHGIALADLESCPSFADVADQITEAFAGADIIVGYNLAFDIEMLQAEYARIGRPAPDFASKKIVDAFRLWQQCEPRSLMHAHQRFVGAEFDAAHTASGDVAATSRVLAGMLRHFALEDQDWDSIAQKSDPLQGRAGVDLRTASGGAARPGSPGLADLRTASGGAARPGSAGLADLRTASGGAARPGSAGLADLRTASGGAARLGSPGLADLRTASGGAARPGSPGLAASWVGPSRHLRWEGDAIVFSPAASAGLGTLGALSSTGTAAVHEIAAGPDRVLLERVLASDVPPHVLEVCRAALELPADWFLAWARDRFGQAAPTATPPWAPLPRRPQ